jgi:NADH-quinone oxidoreductase subunit C
MFGIYVLGNNDFRRILSDYGFKGHPLRKDYPLSGYYEVLFDGHYNNISYFPVEFMQEFRNFEFQNFWGENNTEIL